MASSVEFPSRHPDPHNRLNYGRAPPRSLEDIIIDPQSEWSDIRNALRKGGGAYTNVGLIRTLALGVSIPVNEAPEEGYHHECGQGAFQGLEEPEHSDEQPQAGAATGPTVTEEIIQLKSEESGQATKPARRSSRRKSASLFHASSKTSQSMQSSIASINLLDFGVDHFAMESDTFNNFEEDLGESMSVDSSNGFLGWDHGDENENTCQKLHKHDSQKPDYDEPEPDQGENSIFFGWDQAETSQTASIPSQASSQVSSQAPLTPPTLKSEQDDLAEQILLSFFQKEGLRLQDKNNHKNRDESPSHRNKDQDDASAEKKSWRIEDYETSEGLLFEDTRPTEHRTEARVMLPNPMRRVSLCDPASVVASVKSKGDTILHPINIPENVNIDKVKKALLGMRKHVMEDIDHSVHSHHSCVRGSEAEPASRASSCSTGALLGEFVKNSSMDEKQVHSKLLPISTFFKGRISTTSKYGLGWMAWDSNEMKPDTVIRLKRESSDQDMARRRR